MTRTIRKPVSSLQQLVHQYLFFRAEEKAARKQKEKAYTPATAGKSAIVKHILEHGELDEDGHRTWTFDAPLDVGGKKIVGMKWQANTSVGIDEEAAQRLAEEVGVVDQVTHTEVVWDYEELYVLNQRGKITDKQLEDLLVKDTSYSLTVVED